MKRKYLVILILTITILFASLYTQQKKAEAIAPWVAYVAVNVAVSLSVGLVMYLYDSNNVGSRNTVTNVDEINGIVSFDRLDAINGGEEAQVWTGTYWAGSVSFYPVTDHSSYVAAFVKVASITGLKMNQATADQLAD